MSSKVMTVLAGGLNALGIGKILSKAGSNLKGKIIKRLGAGVWEGLTEAGEEPAEVISKLAAKHFTGQEMPENIGDMFIQSFKEAVTVFPIAGITGAGAATTIGRVEKPLDEILDIAEVAIGDSQRYKPFRSKVLRAGNNAIRAIKADLDQNYKVVFVPTKEDIIEINTPTLRRPI